MPKRMSDREWIESQFRDEGFCDAFGKVSDRVPAIVAAYLRRVARRHDIITGDRSCDNFCRQWLRSLARELKRKGK